MHKQFPLPFLSMVLMSAVLIFYSSSTFAVDPSKKISLVAVQTPPALGVSIPKLEFADDVRAYIKAVLAAPIPANYTLPSDIASLKEYEQAVAKINTHFPEFSEKEGDDLLRAVKNNPIRYQDLILEAKSVREMFFPGSQNKASH